MPDRKSNAGVSGSPRSSPPRVGREMWNGRRPTAGPEITPDTPIARLPDMSTRSTRAVRPDVRTEGERHAGGTRRASTVWRPVGHPHVQTLHPAQWTCCTADLDDPPTQAFRASAEQRLDRDHQSGSGVCRTRKNHSTRRSRIEVTPAKGGKAGGGGPCSRTRSGRTERHAAVHHGPTANAAALGVDDRGPADVADAPAYAVQTSAAAPVVDEVNDSVG